GGPRRCGAVGGVDGKAGGAEDRGPGWSPAPLEPHLLAGVEPLGLTHLGIGPEARPSPAGRDLEAVAHETHGRGMTDGGLPVEVVRLPVALHELDRSGRRCSPSAPSDRPRGGRSLSRGRSRCRGSLRAPPPSPRRTAPAGGCARGRAARGGRGTGTRSGCSGLAPRATPARAWG